MALYSNVRPWVRTLAGTSNDFGMAVEVQGSALSPLLFVVVMQETTRAARGEFFETLKNHNPNFINNQSCRLIGSSKIRELTWKF